ncbi:ABC transporter ATP-binding protein, partial [Paenibacillus kobensis]|uniref:ABC transporter ATP-binding protein n=1 Tax=Paenibacillus kobensis TaxID=59841 RepID=UPI0013E3D846
MSASRYKELVFMLRLVGRIKFRYFAGILLFSLASASMPIILAFVFKLLIDAVLSGEIAGLRAAVVLLGSAFAGLAAVSSLSGYLYQTAVKRAMVRLRVQLFETLCAMQPDQSARLHSGAAASLFANDVPVMERAYTEAFQTTLHFVLLGFGSIAAMFYLDWRFPAGLLVITGVSVWLGAKFMRQLRLGGKRQQNMMARFAEHYADAKAGLSVIQMFGMQRRITRRFDSISGRLNETSVRIGTSTARLEGVEYMMDIVGFAGVVVTGGFLYSYGMAEFGTIVAIVQLQMGFVGIFSGISAPLALLQQSFAASGRVRQWLDTRVEPSNPQAADRLAAGQSAAAVGISWSGVAAGYGDLQPQVLRGVNLQVEAGSTYGIVGWSGCGKSTLIGTLLGFVKPESGTIRIGGRDIESIAPEELRRLIAYVPQESLLFEGTIADNIRHGRLDATDEMVERAAQAAGATAFISRLPGGFSFEVGERGHRLSGGERQRISIARALIKDAPILVMDEPTSSLDGETERAVSGAVAALKGTRTIIVVAHRLSTIEDADRIVVMHDGTVVEHGTHSELLRLGGWYEALYESQAYPAAMAG